MSNEDVLITIAGDSAPLVAATADASAAFSDMAVAADSASADITASMADLAASMADLQTSIEMLAASMDTLAASSTTAAGGVEEASTASKVATVDAEGLGGAIEGVSGAFDMLTGSIMPLITTFGALLAIMGAMTIINDVSSWIQNLISQMFQLDEQTQKTVNSWQFLFAETGKVGSGLRNARELAGWAFQESPKLPFTAMDLRTAISELGTAQAGDVAGGVTPFLGMSPTQVEQFMPYLADVASTLGASANQGQGTNLQKAADAVRMALMGRTMELKTQLNLTPQLLMQYGLKGTMMRGGMGVHITDPQSLYQAIENIVNARGLRGAAQEQELNTFWGAWSSFQDYVHNFLQVAGGIDPATGGTIPGSMFGGLQQVLVAVNSVLGAAAAPGAKAGPGGMSLMGFTDAIGKVLGGGVTSGMSLFEGITGGAGASGAVKIVEELYNKLKDFGDWLESAPIQKDIKQIGETIGQFLGASLESAKKALPDLEHALENLGKAAIGLWNSFSPEQHNQLKQFAGLLVEIVAGIVSFIAAMLTAVAAVHTFSTNVGDFLAHWSSNLANQFKSWGANFIQMLINGIESKLGDLGGMLNRVGDQIKSHLGFQSPPREGVLATSDQWMPNMMNMFAAGIQHGLPAVARASQQAAATIGLIGAVGHPGFGAGGGLSNSYATNYNTTYGGSSGTLNMYGVSNQQLEMAVERVLAAHDQRGFLNFAQPGGFSLFGVH